MDKLTNKQRAFVLEYVKDFNATESARRAGYQGGRNSLAAIGSKNLRKLKISKAISDFLTDKAMLAAEVLYRLARQARGSMADFLEVGEDGVTRFG